MIFYGLFAAGLLLIMAALAYFFPQYGLKLLAAASSKFWALLKPKLFKRLPPEEEKKMNQSALRGERRNPITGKLKDPR